MSILKSHEPLSFVIQKHHESPQHFALSLELDGALRSWTVAKTPALDQDRGTWVPLTQPHFGLENGRLELELHGKKLSGRWRLVRLPADLQGKIRWALVKRREEPSGSSLKKSVEELAGVRITNPAGGAPIYG